MLSGLRPPADGWGHGYPEIHPPCPCHPEPLSLRAWDCHCVASARRGLPSGRKIYLLTYGHIYASVLLVSFSTHTARQPHGHADVRPAAARAACRTLYKRKYRARRDPGGGIVHAMRAVLFVTGAVLLCCSHTFRPLRLSEACRAMQAARSRRSSCWIPHVVCACRMVRLPPSRVVVMCRQA